MGMEIETFIDLSFLLWYGDWTIMYMGIIGYPVHVQWGKLWQCVHWNWGYTTRGYPIDLADAWLMIITTRIEKHGIKWNKMSDPPKLSTNWTYPASNYIYKYKYIYIMIIYYYIYVVTELILPTCTPVFPSTWIYMRHVSWVQPFSRHAVPKTHRLREPGREVGGLWV